MFEARFNSECSACGWTIRQGALAKYDEHNDVVHVICPESEPLRAVGEVCGSCFMEKSATGACDCEEDGRG